MAPQPVRPRQPPRTIPWAELLKRTFQTDVLTCTRCGGRRRVVAVVLRSTSSPRPGHLPPQLGFW